LIGSKAGRNLFSTGRVRRIAIDASGTNPRTLAGIQGLPAGQSGRAVIDTAAQPLQSAHIPFGPMVPMDRAARPGSCSQPKRSSSVGMRPSIPQDPRKRVPDIKG
jgi:hypothetical protein